MEGFNYRLSKMLVLIEPELYLAAAPFRLEMSQSRKRVYTAAKSLQSLK